MTDSEGVEVVCPGTELQPGESMLCTARGTAVACQYSNTATARGTPACGLEATAEDISYYFGTPCP